MWTWTGRRRRRSRRGPPRVRARAHPPEERVEQALEVDGHVAARLEHDVAHDERAQHADEEGGRELSRLGAQRALLHAALHLGLEAVVDVSHRVDLLARDLPL